MRALGIDFGEKRIGIAISDSEGRWALPLTHLERRTDRSAAHAIAEIARREGVAVMVMGEPGDAAGAAALRIRRFGERLARVARLPVVRLDESLTTVEAARRLAAAGLDEPRFTSDRDARRDAVAAQIILQEALDRGLVTNAGESR